VPKIEKARVSKRVRFAEPATSGKAALGAGADAENQAPAELESLPVESANKAAKHTANHTPHADTQWTADPAAIPEGNGHQLAAGIAHDDESLTSGDSDDTTSVSDEASSASEDGSKGSPASNGDKQETGLQSSGAHVDSGSGQPMQVKRQTASSNCRDRRCSQLAWLLESATDCAAPHVKPAKPPCLALSCTAAYVLGLLHLLSGIIQCLQIWSH